MNINQSFNFAHDTFLPNLWSRESHVCLSANWISLTGQSLRHPITHASSVTPNVTLTLESTVLSSGSFTSTCIPSPETDGTQRFCCLSNISTLYFPVQYQKHMIVVVNAQNNQKQHFYRAASCTECCFHSVKTFCGELIQLQLY